MSQSLWKVFPSFMNMDVWRVWIIPWGSFVFVLLNWHPLQIRHLSKWWCQMIEMHFFSLMPFLTNASTNDNNTPILCCYTRICNHKLHTFYKPVGNPGSALLNMIDMSSEMNTAGMRKQHYKWQSYCDKNKSMAENYIWVWKLDKTTRPNNENWNRHVNPWLQQKQKWHHITI